MKDEKAALVGIGFIIGALLGWVLFSDPSTASVVVEACTQTPLFTESGEAVYMCGIN